MFYANSMSTFDDIRTCCGERKGPLLQALRMRLVSVHPVVAADEQVQPSDGERFILLDELR